MMGRLISLDQVGKDIEIIVASQGGMASESMSVSLQEFVEKD
jgi:hypothetical protein